MKLCDSGVHGCGISLVGNCGLQCRYCVFKVCFCCFKRRNLVFKGCNSVFCGGDLAVCRVHSRLKLGNSGLQCRNVCALSAGQRLKSFNCHLCLSFPSFESGKVCFECADVGRVDVDFAVCFGKTCLKVLHADCKHLNRAIDRILCGVDRICQLCFGCVIICKLVAQIGKRSVECSKVGCKHCYLACIGGNITLSCGKLAFKCFHSACQITYSSIDKIICGFDFCYQLGLESRVRIRIIINLLKQGLNIGLCGIQISNCLCKSSGICFACQSGFYSINFTL